MEEWRESSLNGNFRVSFLATLRMAENIIVVFIILYTVAWCTYITYKYNDKKHDYFGLSPRNKIERIFFVDGFLHLLTFGFAVALAAYYAFCIASFLLCFIWSIIAICEFTHYFYFGKPDNK